MEPGETTEEKTMSAAQRRAEIRRRKLLMNSEERMNRIVGYTKNDSESSGASRRSTEPHFHLDLARTEPVSSSSSPKRSSGHGSRSHSATPERRASPLPGFSETLCGSLEDDLAGIRKRTRGDRVSDDLNSSPRPGLQKYLSRFDDAMKLRGQLANEKPAQDGGSDLDEFDPFIVFRLVGSVLLAVFVRLFVCKYLSIFAPFLTLELAYMGLSKYFPKVEKKAQTTVLTAALLLSGIPAEVINRSMDTYRRMGDVFADLCVYFFTFILSHEILLLFGSETP
ncbi:calcium signal-modulating cyclophilin ligand isoform X2 [Takifugu flavidus]|uniref:calcium signal-modulating cyclophilin ligand isoform X2 n=1 Tax=Takifugu flavidus TaxID=433684 RepID=UPI0025447F85|nr:calcium signal-modulating cyclophilin ligand isoform X2 [Takifugu flavidus]